MRVIFTEAAEADLEEIGDYIANDRPRRALALLRKLRAAALRLGHMPKAAPLVPRYESYDIRCRPSGNYLIFYRVEHDQVSVVHVLHGAPDYEALLFPDE